jgi:membrane-associated PAP2 superfamily phosphatase
VEKQRQLHFISHLIAPLCLALLLFMLTYGTGLDFSLASWLYQLEGNHWFLQHHWLTETLLHQYARQLNEILLLTLITLWVWRWIIRKDRSPQQTALGVLVLSLLVSFATVALLKHQLPMECPWDLYPFGGQYAFWGLFDHRPATMTPHQCFPAGHSSIGFAWLALYYYWREVKPQQKQRGLWIGLSLGLVLGLVQQLRGAHFISHDIATAAICWLVSTGVYLLFQRGRSVCTVFNHALTVPSSSTVFPFSSRESSDV